MPQSNFFKVKNLSLHYLDWGLDGNGNPPILLLHGFLSYAHTWDSFAQHLCKDYRVFSLDQRGHGDSGWSESGAYSLDDHVTDLFGFANHIDCEKIILIGHSMGGRNALFFAACYPEKVKGLILVDTRPANTKSAIIALKNLTDRAKRNNP